MTEFDTDRFLKNAKKQGVIIYCRVGTDKNELLEENKLKKLENKINQELKQMWILNHEITR